MCVVYRLSFDGADSKNFIGLQCKARTCAVIYRQLIRLYMYVHISPKVQFDANRFTGLWMVIGIAVVWMDTMRRLANIMYDYCTHALCIYLHIYFWFKHCDVIPLCT